MNEEEFEGFLKYSKEEYDAEIKANFDRIDEAAAADRDEQLQELNRRQAILHASLDKDLSLTEEAREQAKAAVGKRIEIAKSEVSESKIGEAAEEKKRVTTSLRERYGQEDEQKQEPTPQEIRQHEINELWQRQLAAYQRNQNRETDRPDKGRDLGK